MVHKVRAPNVAREAGVQKPSHGSSAFCKGLFFRHVQICVHRRRHEHRKEHRKRGKKNSGSSGNQKSRKQEGDEGGDEHHTREGRESDAVPLSPHPGELRGEETKKKRINLLLLLLRLELRRVRAKAHLVVHRKMAHPRRREKKTAMLNVVVKKRLQQRCHHVPVHKAPGPNEHRHSLVENNRKKKKKKKKECSGKVDRPKGVPGTMSRFGKYKHESPPVTSQIFFFSFCFSLGGALCNERDKGGSPNNLSNRMSHFWSDWKCGLFV